MAAGSGSTLGDAELVAFGVAHDDATATGAGHPPCFTSPGGRKLCHPLLDQPLPLIPAHLPPGNADVEVHAILGGLPLRNPLEVDTGPLALGVDERGPIAELLFWQPDRVPKVLPGGV